MRSMNANLGVDWLRWRFAEFGLRGEPTKIQTGEAAFVSKESKKYTKFTKYN